MNQADAEALMFRHKVRTLNFLRGGVRPSVVAVLLDIPEWVVLRLGDDHLLLSDEDRQRYLDFLEGTEALS